MKLHLTVDGVPVSPETGETGRFRVRFRLVLPAQELRLISGAARPSDLTGHPDDRRLGVMVRGLVWYRDGARAPVSIHQPFFVDGFHMLEAAGTPPAPFRWTNGDAGIPAAAIPSWHGPAVLEFHLKGWEGTQTPPHVSNEAIIFGAFENLGENCELAWVQRHYRVEAPLTMLRWAGTTHEKLTAGLSNRFEGLGHHAKTQIFRGPGDYRLQTPYLNFHVPDKYVPATIGETEWLILNRLTLRTLRRKLLADIAKAKRIFVFRCADPNFGAAEMRRLHDALSAIGPAPLLCVRPGQTGWRDAEVRRVVPGLYAANLDRFVDVNGPFDSWLALCTEVLAMAGRDNPAWRFSGWDLTQA